MRAVILGLGGVIILTACVSDPRPRYAGPPPPHAVTFEHLDECPNPMTESMVWVLVEGVATEVLDPRNVRIEAADGRTILVSIANVGDRATPGATARLEQLLEHRLVSVVINPSNRDATEVAGEIRSGGADGLEPPSGPPGVLAGRDHPARRGRGVAAMNSTTLNA